MTKATFTSVEKEIAEMLQFYLSAARAQAPARAGNLGELQKQARKLQNHNPGRAPLR